MTSHKSATTAVPVHPLLAERWSPRGFDETHELDDTALTALLEAARWAPSANNSQPWRLLVTRRGEAAFDAVAGLLAESNRTWAPAASALVLIAAETADAAGRARPWALYDTGQAVAAMTVQAQAEGLQVHQMGGFDAAGARASFGLGPHLTPLVVVAVGRRTDDAVLAEHLAARERAPRTRLPLADLLLDAGDRSAAPAA
ncbi:MAG TPA: nitroreductase family protein [Mycobacteriales bacterium]|nr:nitroreductase family protein [Mycobacteriales bacterium]